MKTIIVTITTAFFVLFATVDFSQAEKNGMAETIVAENIIEAVNNIDIISLNVLLAEGAAVDTVDEAGNSPLMLAARIGNPRMIQIILAHNPAIDLQNKNGGTALMIATEAGILPIVKKLIHAGANSQLENSNGLTANQIAQRNGHRSVASFLNNSKAVSFSR